MMALRPWLGLVLFATACVAQDPAQTTFPQQWGQQPQQMSGPPGGAMDPGYGYEAPAEATNEPGYPAGYPDGYAPSTEDQAAAQTDQTAGASEAQPEPSADPNDAGYVMGAVTDTEIDATLDAYGSWEDNEDYGRVWRPNTTVVGVDFTPYETCGSWVWSDAGWNYACDWSWGWLPFHYGRWAWFDDYWGWVPGYEWGPGWVDWRHGGGYVGWRPSLPTVRDHRGEHIGPTFHDHRTPTAHDSHWRFANEHDFGHGHVRGHLFQNPSEGLRVTTPVVRPGIRGNYAPVASASLMRARLASNAGVRGQGTWRQPHPTTGYQNPRAQQTWRNDQIPRSQQQPTWQRNQSFQRQNPQTWQRPQQAPQQWQRPQQSWQQPQQQWQRPQQQWQRPQQQWQRPTQSFQRPTQQWHAPSQTSRPSWSTPSHSSGGGFHPSGGGGGGFHPSSGGGGSSHSSGGGSSHSSGGSSHSSGGGGHSSGGGGGHRR